MRIVYPHKLSPQDVFERTNNLLSDLQKTHKDKLSDINKSWGGYSNEIKVLHFSFKLKVGAGFFSKKFFIKGSILLFPENIELHGMLPVAAIPIEKTIKKTILEQMEKTYS